MTNPTDSDRATAERVMDSMTCFKDERCVRPPCACLNAIAAALAAEREACVNELEQRNLPFPAKIIRARSNPKEEK